MLQPLPIAPPYLLSVAPLRSGTRTRILHPGCATRCFSIPVSVECWCARRGLPAHTTVQNSTGDCHVLLSHSDELLFVSNFPTCSVSLGTLRPGTHRTQSQGGEFSAKSRWKGKLGSSSGAQLSQPLSHSVIDVPLLRQSDV